MVNRRQLLASSGIAVTGLTAGCLGGGNDNSETITIGVLYPGPIPDGDRTINGAEYAIQEKNDSGGLLGRDIEMVTADTKLDAQTGTEAARQLIQKENVDFLTGGYSSSVILAIQQLIAGTGPVWAASSVGSVEVLNRIKENYDQYKYFFSPTPAGPPTMRSYAHNIENTVIADIGFDSVVPVFEDHSWTEGATDILRQNMDVTVEDPIRFSLDTTDFSSVFSKVRNSDSQLMFLAMAVADGAAFTTQWAEYEVPAVAAGFNAAAASPSFAEQVGDAALSMSTQQYGAVAPITDVTLPFVEGYREQFNSVPGVTAYLTYDALLSLFHAIESGGELDNDTVVEEIKSLEIPGTTGTLNYYGADSEYPHNAVVDIEDGVFNSVLQWQEENDEYVSKIVGPDEWAGHDGDENFQLPPWM